MKLLYKNYWIFQIFSFLIPLIGLYFPVVIYKIPENGSYIVDGSITLWGTYRGAFPGYSQTEGFIENILISIVSNVCSWALVISSFSLPFISARSIKRKEKMEKSILITWISIASLFVGILVFWTIIINTTIGTVLAPELQDTNFWKYFTPGFGFFTPLISAGILYTSAYLYWKRFREEEIISKIRAEVALLEPPRTQEQKRYEFKETLEKGAFLITLIMMIILAFWILITIALFFMPDAPFLLYILVLPILWGGYFFIFYKVRKFTRGATKIRTLTITDEKIEIQLPNRPIFQVNWDSFEVIEIKEREEIEKFPMSRGKGFRVYYFIFIFKAHSEVLTNFEIYGFELSSDLLDNFILKLKEVASEKNKVVDILSKVIKDRWEKL
ncbi:MAG: hypothetical protein ACFE9T_14260 [Promethearchaeota archaeon]